MAFDNNEVPRRKYLKYGAAITSTGLSGCLGGGDGTGGGGGGTSPTGTTTSTPRSVDSLNIILQSELPPVFKEFENRTGIEINHTTAFGSQTAQKLRADFESGDRQFDLIAGDSAILNHLAEDDREYFTEVELPNPEKTYPENLKSLWDEKWDRTGFYPQLKIINSFPYNTQTVDNPPTSHEDFLREDFAGQDIVTYSWVYLYAIAFFATIGELDRGKEISKGIVDQDPLQVGGSANVRQNIISQEAKVGWYTFPRDLVLQKEKGAPIGFNFPSQLHQLVQGIGALKGGPKVEAAKEFVRFVTSEIGQELIAKTRQFPMHSDVQYPNQEIADLIDQQVDEGVWVVFGPEEQGTYFQMMQEITG